MVIHTRHGEIESFSSLTKVNPLWGSTSRRHFYFSGINVKGSSQISRKQKNLNTYRFGILQNQRICGKARGPKKLDTTICRNSFISQVFKPWHGNRMHNIHKCSNKWYFCFFNAAIATLPSPNLCKYLYIITSILYSYHLNMCVWWVYNNRYSFRRPFCDKCWFLVWRLSFALFKFSLEPRVPPPHGHPPGKCWVPWVPHALMHQRCEPKGCAFVNRMRQRVQWSSAEIFSWLTWWMNASWNERQVCPWK